MKRCVSYWGMERSLRSNIRRIVVLVLLVSFAAKLVVGYSVRSSFSCRGNSHTALNALALNLLQHHEFSIETGTPSVDYEPLYPVMLAVSYGLFGFNWFGPTLFQVVLSGVTSYLVFLIGRRLRGNLAGLVAASYHSLYPYLFFQALSVVDTTLFVFFTITLLHISLCAYRDGAFVQHFVLVGCLAGLALLTRGSAIAIVPSIVLYALTRQRGKMVLASLAVTLAGAIVVLAPWVMRNYSYVATPIVSTHGAFGLWQGNNQYSRQYLENNISLDAVYCQNPLPLIYKEYPLKARSPREAVRVAGEYRSEALRFIAENPLEFSRLCWVKLAKLWSWTYNPYDNSDSSYAYGGHRIRQWAYSVSYLPLLVCFPFGVWFLWKRSRSQALLFLGVILTYTAAHMVVMGYTRLRLPLDPFLMILSAIVVATIVTRLRMAIHTILKTDNGHPDSHLLPSVSDSASVRLNGCPHSLDPQLRNHGKQTATREVVILLAPTPPPYMGPSIATKILLNSRFTEEFQVIHIDTADRRPIGKLGALDLTNFVLAFKHYGLLLWNLLSRHVDVVYIPISQTSIGFLRDAVFILMAWCFRKRVVLHLRGGYFRQFYDSAGTIMKWIVRKCLGCCDRMIVLGSSLKCLFAGLISEEKISVVPNGRDLPLPSNMGRQDSRKEIRVLFLSNLIESKGYKDVLQSAVEVIRRAPNTRFLFAGAWEKDGHKLECAEFIEANRLTGRVEFRGPVTGESKIAVLQEADIFAFPTYYPMEGHPWVLVEAMAAGLPIISTDHGCIAESVIDGINGFIISKRDPTAVAEKIVFLIEHPRVREKMGAASRRMYEENFTSEHFVTRMIDVVSMSFEKKRACKA